MLFDPTTARDALRQVLDEPCGRLPVDLPPYECARSPAAQRASELAAESGLFLFHYEHRVPLPLGWCLPEHADPPEWEDGVLPERKYQSFRHDQALGGYHPGHRAKWTTHELCHGLVGFAWKPGASPLFHATAARLAELVPVVLYYFLDEAFLRRCPAHAGGGALYRDWCEDCEEIAAPDPEDPNALSWLTRAAEFLDGELAAVAKTRRTGSPVEHRFGSLNLATDGLAYAKAHGARLDSEAFEHFAERFLVPGGFGESDLDALEARVVEVVNALVGLGPCRPWCATPEEGRARWIRQDLGWRLLEIAQGSGVDAVLPLVDRVAAGGDVEASWTDLQHSEAVPDADAVFGLGYAGQARGLAHLAAGLSTAVPLTMDLLGEEPPALLEQFARRDVFVRRPLAKRFVDFLRWEVHPLADLCEWEAAVLVAKPDPLGFLGSGTGRRLSRGAQRISVPANIADLAHAVDSGALRFDPDLGLVDAVSGIRAPKAPDVQLWIGRDSEDRLVVADLPNDADLSSLDGSALATLEDLGLVVPTSWPVD